MQLEKNRRVLVIDDSPAIHEDFRKILERDTPVTALDTEEALLFGHGRGGVAPERYVLDSAYQGEEGFAKVCQRLASQERYAVAFVDMRMPPGWDGLQTIERILEVDPEVQVVMCTAYSDYSWKDMVDRLGITDRLLILKKPFDTAEVAQVACALTEKWRLTRNAHLKLSQLTEMVDEQTRYLKHTNEQLMAEAAERQRSAIALKASEDRYALAAAGANDGLWDADVTSGTVFYSDRWKSVIGLVGAEIASTAEAWLARIHPDDRERFETDLEAHLSGGASHFSNEHRLRHKDGGYRWVLSRGMAIRDASGRAVRIAGSLTDITERKLAEEQLRYAAHHDALTGLANRALLTDRIARCMARARKRNATGVFAVIFVDLDRFKIINDTRGHAIGDRVLIEIANRLATNLRDTDTIARQERDCLARLGGDEFVLLVEDLRDTTDAIRVADRILKALARPFRVDGHEIHSPASIGIAISDPRYQVPEEMLRDADGALYTAKMAGKGRYKVFDEEIHRRTLDRWQLENELRHAIDHDELLLHYQPILSLDSDRIWEVEALVRWRHPVRGVVSPGVFIPVAEETGLVVALGAWVLRRACRQFVEWRDRLGRAPCSIAVNVSSKQFVHEAFAEHVAAILDESGMDPSCLRLEITESAMVDVASAVATLKRLRELDLRIHLDDFGTGYSSLSYLQHLPIDALKIDRSFVDAMTRDEASGSIVQAIIGLAHSMRLQVIAEGVETVAQLEALRGLGCDHAQGFLMHRPMDATALEALLARE